MKLKTFTIAVALVLALFLFAQHRTPAPKHPDFNKVVDLTHTAGTKSPTYEISAKPQFSAHVVDTVAKDGYFARDLAFPEHFSTHIDAPAHFAPGRWTVDQIPTDRMLAPVVMIDVAEKAKRNADYQLTPEDISDWEKANGDIPLGSVVLLRTGWAEKWNSQKDYRNADSAGTMHFPGYSVDAARFLVEAREAVGLGIDTLSVDYGPSKDFPVHHYTAGKSVYHLENVADVWRVPATGSLVLVAPAKIEGASGGPVRIFALVR